MTRKNNDFAAIPLLVGFISAFILYFPAAEYQDVRVLGVRLFWPFFLLIICLLLGGGLLSVVMALARR